MKTIPAEPSEGPDGSGTHHPDPVDLNTARVAYLAHLKEEFTRIWPGGRPRSSEYDENKSFRDARDKIEKLTRRLDGELL
jgi:hypothetical protein